VLKTTPFVTPISPENILPNMFLSGSHVYSYLITPNAASDCPPHCQHNWHSSLHQISLPRFPYYNPPRPLLKTHFMTHHTTKTKTIIIQRPAIIPHPGPVKILPTSIEIILPCSPISITHTHCKNMVLITLHIRLISQDNPLIAKPTIQSSPNNWTT